MMDQLMVLLLVQLVPWAAPAGNSTCGSQLDGAVEAVLHSVRRQREELGCDTSTRAVVAYLGGDSDLQACKMQGFWGKSLRLAGAHASAFADRRRLVLATPDPWIGCLDGGGWHSYFESSGGGTWLQPSAFGLHFGLLHT